ncbi:MAG: V-type ATPase subunit [Deltaproteobacteria bacterium]
MSDDFGYLNARIRCRRRELLHEGFFREALTLSFPELVKVLGETQYGADLTGDSLSDVDRAVRVHLDRTVTDLPRVVSGEAREAVSLLLMRKDLANVKTILRGKRIGRSTEEIMGSLGGGTLPRGFYSAMVETPDVASLAQVLSIPKHPLARALREASQAGEEPLVMETILDRAFYAAMRRRSRELDQPYLADFISFEIDALNLSTSLKLFSTELEGPFDQYFLPGGRLVEFALFQRLSTGEVAAMEELGDTDFARVAEVRDLPGLERGLGCVLLAKAKEGARDALGAGLAIDYIQRKEWEAGRIRLLARRAYYGLSSALVEQEVFCE